MKIKNAKMKGGLIRTRAMATVAPVFYDDFETYDNEDDAGTYTASVLGSYTAGVPCWWTNELDPDTMEMKHYSGAGSSYAHITGEGANGTFTQSGPYYWTVDYSLGGTLVDFTGLKLYLLGADWKPISGSPFTVTSNTAATMSFSGDATGALYNERLYPRVSDAVAYTGSQSLKMPFGPCPDIDAGFGDARSEQRFGFGEYLTEGWLEWWLYVPANYTHRLGTGTANNKFLILYNHTYGSHEANLWGIETLPTSGDSWFRWYGWTNDYVSSTECEHNTTDMFISPSGPIRTGAWNRIRIHWKSSTTDSSYDGVWQVYVYNATNGPTTMVSVTNGHYWPKNPSNIYSGNGGLGIDNGYFLGAANSGYLDRTVFYVDGFSLFKNNPGW